MSKDLKRLGAPKFWHVKKKEKKWAVRPRPGPHRKFDSIPLAVLLRDVLGVVGTGAEARSVIKSRKVVVDGKARRDPKYPAGLMDVVHIQDIDKSYRIVPSKEGLEPVEVSKEEASKKICRIDNKTVLKSGIQLNCHDGRNILIKDNKDKEKGRSKGKDYKTGDSLLIELPSQKILEHLKLDKGSTALVTKGSNAGQIGKIKSVMKATAKEKARVLCELDTKTGKKDFEILKDHIFIVGKTEPLIKLSEWYELNG